MITMLQTQVYLTPDMDMWQIFSSIPKWHAISSCYLLICDMNIYQGREQMVHLHAIS